MRILAIDPSFTSTGLAVLEGHKLIFYKAIHAGGTVYKGNDTMNMAAKEIVEQILSVISEYQPDTMVFEIPAPSPSGFYLMALHGWIISSTFNLINTIYSVPPTACDSFIKNKEHSKSYIVNYCKEKGWVPPKRINNDICTAVVLAKLIEAHTQGKYKNKVFLLKKL